VRSAEEQGCRTGVTGYTIRVEAGGELKVWRHPLGARSVCQSCEGRDPNEVLLGACNRPFARSYSRLTLGPALQVWVDKDPGKLGQKLVNTGHKRCLWSHDHVLQAISNRVTAQQGVAQGLMNPKGELDKALQVCKACAGSCRRRLLPCSPLSFSNPRPVPPPISLT
jgi:hypothetical protein